MWPPLCGQFLGEKDDFIGADWFSACECNQFDFSKPNGNVIKDLFFFFVMFSILLYFLWDFCPQGKLRNMMKQWIKFPIEKNEVQDKNKKLREWNDTQRSGLTSLVGFSGTQNFL